MKTKNMPYAKYRRRVRALERLEENRSSRWRKRYSESPSGRHELSVLDERIKGYAESGQRPSRGPV
jgi:hypothetical protein